jgi:CubicO group peptidase (beta-lactamase class C family)
MKKNTIRLLAAAILLFIILLTACQSEPEIQPTPTPEITYYPAAEWRVSTPEEQGLDPELLDEMLDEIDRKYWDVDNITIIRYGHKVFDVSLGSYQEGEIHLMYSCTKSFVSALVGIAIDQGYIQSVDVPLADLFPDREIQNLDSRKQMMTLEHLLSMSSGFECRDSYLHQWVGLNEMIDSEDWVQHVLDLPMEFQPGTHFEYCNGVSNLLSAIVQDSTGIHTAAFAEQHLFGPLGIEEYFWEIDPAGYALGFSELYLKPSDMARFGYLYLRGGVWDGEQIVSSDWVNESSTVKVAAATLQDGYGYQWWTDAGGYYMALGYRGQFIFVLPKYDMVVVFVSDPEVGDFDAPEFLLTNYIIPAAQAE